MTIDRMTMSLCILTHNRRKETDDLICSIARFKGLELEICIADQMSCKEDVVYFKSISDHYTIVTDKQLWDQGFGFAKQQAVDLATNEWVIIGDPGEIWHENFVDWKGLVGAIDDTHRNALALRVLRGRADKVKAVLGGDEKPFILKDDNGRVFNKRMMKMLGLIHEAPIHKATGALWSEWARPHPAIAFVEHEAHHDEDPMLTKRKQILYDHLIHTIVHNPQLRLGTDMYWWDEHYHKVVVPRYRPVTFEQWQKMGG